MAWTAREIPPQIGRTAVVTGADNGPGYITALELARHGAHVTLACDGEQRGSAAVRRLLREVPEAEVEFRRLDLADLESIHSFAEELPGGQLDLLINNAELMAVPYARTVDGFETQFGVNHLGHFALTALLLDRLLATPDSRVVTVSSMSHVMSNIDIHDLNSEVRYHRWQVYARTKTANLLFIHELARRLAGRSCVAAAVHPGHTATDPHTKGPRLAGRRAMERVTRLGDRLIAATAELGATPTLYAATAPGVRPDSFSGPRFALRGGPAPAWRAPWTYDGTAAHMLWESSAGLTGVAPPL